MSNASWSTASATGALSLMLQLYVAYKFDPVKMQPAQADAAMGDVRKAMARLVATDQIGQQLQIVYEKAFAEND